MFSERKDKMSLFRITFFLQLGLGQIMLKPSSRSETRCAIIGSYLQQHQKHHFFRTLFRDTYTARLRQKRGMIILSLQFSSNLSGVSQKQKKRSERGSIAPWKVFAHPESFGTEHIFVYYFRNLAEKSLKFLESF